MKPGLMGTPAAGDNKMELFPTPGHSPDVLLGVMGASNQAGDQVCKAGTPQDEELPPAPQHTPTSAPEHPIPLPNRILSSFGFCPSHSHVWTGRDGWPLGPCSHWPHGTIYGACGSA